MCLGFSLSSASDYDSCKRNIGMAGSERFKCLWRVTRNKDGDLYKNKFF